MPDVPTFRELGVDWVDGAYRGIGVPKSTPMAERKRLSDLWRALNTARNEFITYRVCYCSVFNECWINTVKGRNQLDPERVGKCAMPPVPYTE